MTIANNPYTIEMVQKYHDYSAILEDGLDLEDLSYCMDTLRIKAYQEGLNAPETMIMDNLILAMNSIHRDRE